MSRILGRVRHHLPRNYTPAISRFSVFSTMSAPQPNSEPASETYKPRYIDVFPPPMELSSPYNSLGLLMPSL